MQFGPGLLAYYVITGVSLQKAGSLASAREVMTTRCLAPLQLVRLPEYHHAFTQGQSLIRSTVVLSSERVKCVLNTVVKCLLLR